MSGARNKALADRLANAFAKRPHRRVRIEFLGCASDEALSNEALMADGAADGRRALGLSP